MLTALNRLVGLKVVAIKGYPSTNNEVKNVEAQFILMSDEKTIINLEEQDPYSYHDCSAYARNIQIYSNPEFWREVIDNYPDATNDSFIG